jgi:hypothetical protein
MIGRWASLEMGPRFLQKWRLHRPHGCYRHGTGEVEIQKPVREKGDDISSQNACGIFVQKGNTRERNYENVLLPVVDGPYLEK